MLTDSIRVILLSVEKSNLSDKGKLGKWLISVFQDFMEVLLPQDVINNKVEDFFENIPEEEEPRELENEKEGEEEMTRNIIAKWIDSDYPISDPGSDSRSLTDLAQDPINLKRDITFARYLPLRHSQQIFYCPGSLYVFLRYFYTVYERLLNIKIILSGQNAEECGSLERGDYAFSEQTEAEYLSFLKLVCSVLKNTCDSAKFEEKCRNLLKNDAYIYFTFDKLVAGAAKALHAVAHEEPAQKSLSLFYKFSRHHLNEEMYLAEFLAVSPTTSLFRLHWNKQFKVLSVTFVEHPADDPQGSSVALKLSLIHI